MRGRTRLWNRHWSGQLQVHQLSFPFANHITMLEKGSDLPNHENSRTAQFPTSVRSLSCQMWVFANKIPNVQTVDPCRARFNTHNTALPRNLLIKQPAQANRAQFTNWRCSMGQRGLSPTQSTRAWNPTVTRLLLPQRTEMHHRGWTMLVSLRWNLQQQRAWRERHKPMNRTVPPPSLLL